MVRQERVVVNIYVYIYMHITSVVKNIEALFKINVTHLTEVQLIPTVYKR
jgi:hypothetical protein